MFFFNKCWCYCLITFTGAWCTWILMCHCYWAEHNRTCKFMNKPRDVGLSLYRQKICLLKMNVMKTCNLSYYQTCPKVLKSDLMTLSALLRWVKGSPESQEEWLTSSRYDQIRFRTWTSYTTLAFILTHFRSGKCDSLPSGQSKVFFKRTELHGVCKLMKS